MVDTFIDSKIKDVWTRQWDAKKLELIQDHGWHNMPWANDQWLGKLTNPNKRFFLKLVPDSVEDVNEQIGSSNISYARKAMIHCGLAYGINDTWNVN